MICCVTGNRPQKFPFEYSQSCEQFQSYILKLTQTVNDYVANGFDHFIVGMALGVDLDFAEAVIKSKQNFLHKIVLEAAIPCCTQTKFWSDEDKSRYNMILTHCDIVNVISETYTRWCMSKRNKYMVDKADHVIAVWNGQQKGGTWNTIKYVEKCNKPLEYIMLTSID